MNETELKTLVEQSAEDMPTTSQARVRANLAAALAATPAASARTASGPEVMVAPIELRTAASRRRARTWIAVIGTGAIAAAAAVIFAVSDRSEHATVSGSNPSTPDVSVSDPAVPNPTASSTTIAHEAPTTSAAPPVTTVPVALPEGATLPSGVTIFSVTFPTVLDGWITGYTDAAHSAFRHTTDGGITWSTVTPPAPLLANSDSSATSDLWVAFADPSNGWLVGAGSESSTVLLATHDGGVTWSSITPTDAPSFSPAYVAAGSGQVHVMSFESPGFRIYSAPAGSDDFTASPAVIPPGAGPVFDPRATFGGNSGWLVFNDRVLIGSARLMDGQWVDWQAPCSRGTTADNAAVAAAPDGSALVVACRTSDFADPPRSIRLERSLDGGDTFTETAALPGTTQAQNVDGSETPALGFVVVPSQDVIVVGYYTGADGRISIVRSTDGGATWTEVHEIQRLAAPLFEFTVTDQPGAPIVVVTGSGTGIVSNDEGATWNGLAQDDRVVTDPVVSLAQIDLDTGTIFGFDAGNAPDTNSPSPETLMATVTPLLGEPDLDTGWYTVPAHPDPSGADCWGGATARVLIWGDLSFLFADDGIHEFLTNWQLGGTDYPARGIDLVVPAPTPYPTGITTTPPIDGRAGTFGLGSSRAALIATYPGYDRGAPVEPGDFGGFGGRNLSLSFLVGDGADTITRISVENGC